VFVNHTILEMKDIKELTGQDANVLLEIIMEKLPNSVWIIPIELEEGIQWISSTVSMQRGFTPEEVKNQTLEDIFTPESLEVVSKAVQEEIALENNPDIDKNRIRILELEMKCKDGSTIWTENQVSFLHDDSGDLVAFLGVTKDITDKKIAIERKDLVINVLKCLNESADDDVRDTIKRVVDFIRENFENLMVSIDLFDQDNGEVGFSSPQESSFNRTEHESLWTDSLAVIPIKVRQKIIGVMRMEASGTDVFNKDLIEFFEWLSGSLGVAVDRDKMRKELELKQEQLIRGQRLQAIGTLVAGIAHDFNNLLVPVVSGADLLAMDNNDKESRMEIISLIRESGEKASKLVNHLLAFGRKQHLKVESLEVKQLFSGLKNILENIIGENINLSFLTYGDLNFISVDQSQIEQVIMNLIINAHDAITDGGKITVTAKNKHLETDQMIDGEWLRAGEYISIEVADTGSGISEDNINKIFEPFFTTKPFGKGSGMGLAVVHGIIHQHGGVIDVRSKVGEGTTFEIILPISKKEDPQQQNAKVL